MDSELRDELDKLWTKLSALELDAARSGEAAKARNAMLDTMSGKIDLMAAQLQALNITLAQAGGGMRTALWLASAASAAVAFAVSHVIPLK